MLKINNALSAIGSKWMIFFFKALLAFLPIQLSAQQHAGQYDVADIAYGAQLFAGRCVVCHGADGDLMPRANLRSGTFRNASSDRDLMRVIRDGIEGTAMASTGYADAELTALVAYVRNITNFNGSGEVLGDPSKGKELFNGKGECLSCHNTGLGGPKYAPHLGKIGITRTAAALRRAMQDSSEGMLPINRELVLETNSGELIRGRRLNEDTYSVQLITREGNLLSLDKTQLISIEINKTSSMPNYGTLLSEQEHADLLAYLLSLKGPVFEGLTP